MQKYHNEMVVVDIVKVAALVIITVMLKYLKYSYVI